MRTARTISACLLGASLALAAACAHNPQPRVPGAAPTALAVLRERAPDTVWEPKSEVRGDLDGDGVPDVALRGVRADRVVVGIVQGPLKPDSRVWRLEFPWGKGTEDSLCSRRARIAIEDTAGEPVKAAGSRPPTKGAKRLKGIDLYDDRCDSFHIYWSAEKQKFDWWRL